MLLSKGSVVSRNDQCSEIKIFSFKDSNIQGVFSNGIYGEKVFLNLTSMILMVEDCMNSISFPHPMFQYRTMDIQPDMELSSKKFAYRDAAEFTIPQEEQPAEWEGRKPLATVRFRIMFRTISGWQGEAELLENGKKKKFRSDLEFIMFIVDALKARSEAEESFL